MANTVEECQRMVEACYRNRVRLMIGYRKYFDPACIALKTLVDAGKLSRLRIIHCTFTTYFPPGLVAPWHYDRKLAGGGSLMDVGVYCVNAIRWLSGQEPVETTAYGAWTPCGSAT